MNFEELKDLFEKIAGFLTNLVYWVQDVSGEATWKINYYSSDEEQ